MQSETGFWAEDTRADALERELDTAGDLAFVWEDNGEVVGYASAHDMGFRADLSHLIIAKPYRNRGIGSHLVGHIEAILRDRGCKVLLADVMHDVAGFYHALGWSDSDMMLVRKRL
jgi:ribosomal protein S18 acetylase RimI-like enzyme